MDVFERISNIKWKTLIFLTLLFIVLFSLIFYFISLYSVNNGLSVNPLSFFSALYFSLVTFSSLGYGDISPLGFSRFFAMIEVASGLIFMGIIISKIVSIRQEKILTRLYHMEYVEHIRSIRHALSNKRLELERISTDLYHHPRNEEFIKKANELFRGNSNIFRQIASPLKGCAGFLKAEKEREEPILLELDIFHIELLANSVLHTLKEVNSSLERFKHAKYTNWKKSRTLSDIKTIRVSSEHILKFIDKNYNSEKIKEASDSIKKILRDSKKNY